MSRTRVLLVDDEREFADALVERLQLRGYEARAAFSSAEAVAAARAEPPDVVLLDLNLPGVRGAELLLALRQDLPDAEILLLSGNPDLAGEIVGSTQEASALLLKPVDLPELIARIDAARAKRGSHAAH